MSNPTFEEGALARRKKPGEALNERDTLLPSSPYGIHQTTPPTLADGDVAQQQLDDMGNIKVTFGDPAQLFLLTGIDTRDMRIDYDVNNNPIYVGKADSGANVDDAVWAIQKFTWTGTNMTYRQFATGSWSGRVALF